MIENHFKTTASSYYEITRWQSELCKSIDKNVGIWADKEVKPITHLLLNTTLSTAAVLPMAILTVAKSVCLIAEPLIKGLGALAYGVCTLNKEIFAQGLESILIDVPVSIGRVFYQISREVLSKDTFSKILANELIIKEKFNKDETYLKSIEIKYNNLVNKSDYRTASVKDKIIFDDTNRTSEISSSSPCTSDPEDTIFTDSTSEIGSLTYSSDTDYTLSFIDDNEE